MRKFCVAFSLALWVATIQFNVLAQPKTAAIPAGTGTVAKTQFDPKEPSYENITGQFESPGVHFSTKSDFVFIDQNNRKWTAPKKTITDGASIPQLAMSVIGAPTDALYMKAAIIHDAYCAEDNKNGSSYHRAEWQDVHRMFYDALLVAGTDKVTAKTMYAAVWLFGPRKWVIQGKNKQKVPIKDTVPAKDRRGDEDVIEISQTDLDELEINLLDVTNASETLKKEQLAALSKVIKDENPTMVEIDAMLEKAAKQLHAGTVYKIPGREER